MKSKGVTTFYLADVFGDLSKMIDTDVNKKNDSSEKKQKINEKLSQLEEVNRNLENRLKQKDLNEQDRAQASVEFKVNKIAIDTMKKLLKNIE